MDLRLATLKQYISICCTMFQHESYSVKDVRDLHIFDRTDRALYPQDGGNKVIRNLAKFHPLCHD